MILNYQRTGGGLIILKFKLICSAFHVPTDTWVLFKKSQKLTILLSPLGGDKGPVPLDFQTTVFFFFFLHRFTQDNSVLTIQTLWVPEDDSWWRLADEIKVVQGPWVKFSGIPPGSPVPITFLGHCMRFYCRNCLFNSLSTFSFVLMSMEDISRFFWCSESSQGGKQSYISSLREAFQGRMCD